MCSSNTRATVLDWLVGDGELAQVVTAHFRLRKRKNVRWLIWKEGIQNQMTERN